MTAWIWLIIIAIILYIIYYTLIVSVLIEMLNANTNTVLLVFTFFGLLPWAFLVGILTMIIWSKHKNTLANT